MESMARSMGRGPPAGQAQQASSSASTLRAAPPHVHVGILAHAADAGVRMVLGTPPRVVTGERFLDERVEAGGAACRFRKRLAHGIVVDEPPRPVF